MPGTLLQAYYERMDQLEAVRVLTYAHAMSLPYADDAGRQAVIDRAYPPMGDADDPGFVFRYEGRPVSLSLLKTQLKLRWGHGFEADRA